MKVLIYTFFRDDLSGLIRDEFPNLNIVQTRDLTSALAEAPDTDILIVNKPCDEVINSAPNLKWIQTLSSGVDFLPLQLIEQRNIVLSNTAGIHSSQMSEYAIAAMIMLSRNFQVLMHQQFEKNWNGKVSQGEIFGSTLGILGLGNIGKSLAEKAKIFGMNVIGINRSGNDVMFVDDVYTMDNINIIARESDYVVNLLPLTDETYHSIDAKFFNEMKESACFINIGRGPTVNETDFVNALLSNKIRAGFSDVFESEPLASDSSIWDIPNLVITPHICGINDQYFDKALRVISPNLSNFLAKGKPLSNVVNLKLGY